MTEESRTPFIYFLMGVLAFYYESNVYPWSLILDVWLGDLMNCGVDIFAYGLRERELHEEGLSNWDLKNCWMNREEGIVQAKLRLVSFTYGNLPSDWHVAIEQVNEPDEDSDQTRAVPGGWVEE
jgi:hypothetical protein